MYASGCEYNVVTCTSTHWQDDDLRSALCLEQAAYAFLRTRPSMERKFALHLILAGHRYARSTQRVHSARVYKQALEVYTGKGWTLAEVNYIVLVRCSDLLVRTDLIYSMYMYLYEYKQTYM